MNSSGDSTRWVSFRSASTTYDAAGEFAFKVGLPCRSGVGGAIVAIVPGQLVLCAWLPGLDETGNSQAARRALELFVARTGLSAF